jgi:hypothetical protein
MAVKVVGEAKPTRHQFEAPATAGDGTRTHNLQLGNLNFRSFIFNTYKIAPKKCTCMRRITVHALPDSRVAGGRLGDGCVSSANDNAINSVLIYRLESLQVFDKRIPHGFDSRSLPPNCSYFSGRAK